MLCSSCSEALAPNSGLASINERVGQRTVQETVSEQLGRFNMWAGTAGTHRSGKISLDYRLREAPHVHTQVLRLLENLNQALAEGQSPILTYTV